MPNGSVETPTSTGRDSKYLKPRRRARNTPQDLNYIRNDLYAGNLLPPLLNVHPPHGDENSELLRGVLINGEGAVEKQLSFN